MQITVHLIVQMRLQGTLLNLIVNAGVGATQAAGPDTEHKACKVQLKWEVSSTETMQFKINCFSAVTGKLQSYV